MWYSSNNLGYHMWSSSDHLGYHVWSSSDQRNKSQIIYVYIISNSGLTQKHEQKYQKYFYFQFIKSLKKLVCDRGKNNFSIYCPQYWIVFFYLSGLQVHLCIIKLDAFTRCNTIKLLGKISFISQTEHRYLTISVSIFRTCFQNVFTINLHHFHNITLLE
jgi:hypothetical protein